MLDARDEGSCQAWEGVLSRLNSLRELGSSWQIQNANLTITEAKLVWEEFGEAMEWPLVGFKVILPNHIATQEGMSSNFRDITLLSLFNKVYARVLERFVIWTLGSGANVWTHLSHRTLDELYLINNIWECLRVFSNSLHVTCGFKARNLNMSPGVSRAVLQVDEVSGRVLVYPVLISPHKPCTSLVHIADYKSDLVAGLSQNCLLSPFLFMVFMDRFSRCRLQVQKVQQFQDFTSAFCRRCTSACFADQRLLVCTKVFCSWVWSGWDGN